MTICKKIGLSTNELSDLTVGQIQDYMIEYIKTEEKINNGGNDSKTRKATQADFDAF